MLNEQIRPVHTYNPLVQIGEAKPVESNRKNGFTTEARRHGEELLAFSS